METYFNFLPIELLSIITSYLIIEYIILPNPKGSKFKIIYNKEANYNNYYNFLKVLAIRDHNLVPVDTMINIAREIPEMVFHIKTNVINMKQIITYSPTFYKIFRKWIKPRIDQDNPTVLMKHVVFKNLKPIEYYSTKGFDTKLKEQKLSSFKYYKEE